MTSSSPRLVVRHGPNPSQEYPLVLSSNIIGREPINDVVFPDPEVSRRHARIVAQNNNYYIEDLGSTNGTFVNGRRISSVTRLSNGDIIDLGESIRLTFILEQILDTTEPTAPVEVNGTTANQDYSPPILQTTPLTADDDVASPSSATAALQSNPYLLYGCGFVLTLVILCGLTLFLLNRVAPDLLSGFLP